MLGAIATPSSTPIPVWASQPSPTSGSLTGQDAIIIVATALPVAVIATTLVYVCVTIFCACTRGVGGIGRPRSQDLLPLASSGSSARNSFTGSTGKAVEAPVIVIEPDRQIQIARKTSLDSPKEAEHSPLSDKQHRRCIPVYHLFFSAEPLTESPRLDDTQKASV